MQKLILVDGNAILHRAYHSLPPFKTSKGEVTNAIYGFLRMLFDIYSRQKPDYIGIMWDRKAPTFRHKEYKEYKATRSAAPDDLYPQLPRLKQVLEAFGIPQLEMDGYEADDLLGTMAHCAEKEQDLNVLIVTGDKDALQLVTEKTTVMAPIKGMNHVLMYTPQVVEEKMGVRPDQIVDYKALCGDSSDNIKGVAGIGPKQAVELLKQYNTLENIYAHLDQLTPGQQKKFEDNREVAYLSQRLCQITRSAPLPFRLDDYKTHRIDYTKVEQLFHELEFQSLIKKLETLRKTLVPVAAEQTSLF